MATKSPRRSNAERRRAAGQVKNLLGPVERRYVSALRGAIAAVHREYERRLFPLLGEIADLERKDAPGDTLKGTIDVLGVEVQYALQRTAGPLFDRMARDVLVANAKGQALMGIRLGGIRGATRAVTNTAEGIRRDIAEARNRNIELVENAHRVYAAQVREIFADPENFGLRVEDLKRLLRERAEVSESRAELIARDQTLKLNGQITATRQMRAGVERYVWSTSQDERVRDSHAELEGQTFSWTEPPEVGHPGQDFQCRCVALPVVEEFEDLF
jgi:SPP1 gp7 family putative phage head morphogenesis protein